MKISILLLALLCFPLYGDEVEPVAEPLAKPLVEPVVEPLIRGKEGKDYQFKNLFRRGQDYYEVFTIEKDAVRIEEKPIEGPTTKPQFLPKFSQRQDLLNDFVGYGANDFVELYFQMNDFPQKADTLYILNRLLQMSTMTGIKYFSTRQQEMTTYITSCFIVDKPKSRKKLAPPSFSSLPTEPVHLLIRQDDNRFTPTWYDVTIRIGEDGSLRMTMENATPIYVQFIFFFKAIEARKVRHEIVILPNSAEIYALSQIFNTRKSVLGIELDLGNSFNRRMSAIQGWLQERIYQ